MIFSKIGEHFLKFVNIFKFAKQIKFWNVFKFINIFKFTRIFFIIMDLKIITIRMTKIKKRGGQKLKINIGAHSLARPSPDNGDV